MTIEFKAAVPVLPVSDIARAARFYAEKLGFRIGYEDQSYAILIRDSIEIHLWAANDTRWKGEKRDNPVISGAETFLAGTASCRVFIAGIDTLYEDCNQANVVHPNGALENKPHGLREFAILDCDGNQITFYQAIPK